MWQIGQQGPSFQVVSLNKVFRLNTDKNGNRNPGKTPNNPNSFMKFDRVCRLWLVWNFFSIHLFDDSQLVVRGPSTDVPVQGASKTYLFKISSLEY